MPTASRAATPWLAELPPGAEPRLIDAGLLQYEASSAGRGERYERGKTPHTIHVWWARRPYTAMRALAYATLCKSHTPGDLDLLAALSSSLRTPEATERARSRLAEQYGRSPRVLDMFAGGGTIPSVLASLGARVSALDSNQLAVLIQRANLRAAGDEVALLVEEAGRRVLTRLARETAPLFVGRSAGTLAYLWTYAATCACGGRYLLSKRPWLSRRRGRRLAIQVVYRDGELSLRHEEAGSEFESVWRRRGRSVCCPHCGEEGGGAPVSAAQDVSVAWVLEPQGSGKRFVLPRADAPPVDHLEREVLADLETQLPSAQLPRWSGIVNPAIHGIRTYADVLTPRQRTVLLLLIRALREEHAGLRQDHDPQLADAALLALSGLVDQLVDWNCRLSMWISQNEQVGRAFSGPGVPMLWDFAEIDPLLRGPANLWSKLERIVRGVRFAPAPAREVTVTHGLAQELPFADGSFDAVVTDPPYYDNLYYSVLADFFFPWKRMTLTALEPELLAVERTESARELVASTFRSGDRQEAHASYIRELGLALNEAARVLQPGGVLCLIYAHASVGGWEALVRAFRSSDLVLTSAQPLSIERRQRPRAMRSKAINTCVVLVARRPAEPVERRTRSLEDLRETLAPGWDGLQPALDGAGWSSADVGVALFAQAVGLLANASSLLACDDLRALEALAADVTARCPEFRLVRRPPL